MLPETFNELAEMESHFKLKEQEKQDPKTCWNFGGYDSKHIKYEQFISNALQGTILAVAISKDSQTTVSAAKNGTVKVLNLKTKQELSQVQEYFGKNT